MTCSPSEVTDSYWELSQFSTTFMSLTRTHVNDGQRPLKAAFFSTQDGQLLAIDKAVRHSRWDDCRACLSVVDQELRVVRQCHIVMGGGYEGRLEVLLLDKRWGGGGVIWVCLRRWSGHEQILTSLSIIVHTHLM